MPRIRRATACAVLLSLAACGAQEPPAAAAPVARTPVTVAVAEQRRVEVIERSVGRLEAPGTPAVSAETAGRVAEIRVDAGHGVTTGEVLARLDGEQQRNAERVARAGVERIEPLLENQQRTVARTEDLVRRNLAAQSALDDARSEYAALRAQLAEARARLDDAVRDLGLTVVRSPVTGIVQNRRISVGDFVAVGQPLFDIVVADRMRAVAPFPETLGDRLRLGQQAFVAPVRAPGETVETAIAELRPQVGTNSRSIDAILEFDNPGHWRAGASVAVAVVVDVRERSVTVPAQSIVRRPAGTVVYVVTDGVARERAVETGVQTGAWVEILAGLEGGEPVVRSGAGFLTDGAAVDAGGSAGP